MNIIKCYQREQNGEVFAVLTDDNGERYRMVTENLNSAVILDPLLESGWELCGLPYDLRKNGMTMSELPHEIWLPTPQEEQELYDTRQALLEPIELKKRLTISELPSKSSLPTDYRIMTREDFLSFINSNEFGSDIDFLPLNYFVHPLARFGIDEYSRSGALKDKVANRRIMSETRLNGLINWAVSGGLSPDFKQLDLIEFYFSWGVDGVTAPTTPPDRITRTHNVRGERDSEGSRYRAGDFGLLDADGYIDCKPGYKPIIDDSELQALAEKLPESHVTPVFVTKDRPREVIQFTVRRDNVLIDEEYFVIVWDGIAGKLAEPSLRCSSLSGEYWNFSEREKGIARQYIKALAAETQKRMTVKSDVSSYQALTESGFSPKGALRYYVGTFRGVPEEDGEKPTNVTAELIDTYFADRDPEAAAEELGLSIESTEKGYAEIEDFLNGTANTDGIKYGIESDAYVSAAGYTRDFSAAVKFCGISPDDIYKKVCGVDTTLTDLRFEGNGVKLYVPLNIADGKVKGYANDKRMYERRLASLRGTYDKWVYVTCAARELGSEKARRHAAFSAYVLDFYGQTSKANNALDDVKALLREALLTFVPPSRQDAFINRIEAHTAEEFFRIALYGEYRLPTLKTCKPAPPGLQDKFRALLGGAVENGKQTLHGAERVQDTCTFCDYAVTPWGDPMAYCVNANILPTRITPKMGYFIPERPLFAVWRGREWLDFRGHPVVGKTVEECLEYRLINKTSEPWMRMRPVCPTGRSVGVLTLYCTKDNETRREYPGNLEYICAEHPYDAEYARFSEPPVPSVLPVPRKDFPRPALYPTVILTAEEAAAQSTAAQTDTGFHDFREFDAADFYFNKSKLPKLPEMTDARERVFIPLRGKRYFLTADGKQHHYAEVAALDFDKVAGVSVRGSKYVLLDIQNRLWEVTV